MAARLDPGSSVDHDFLVAYLDHMKGVYQDALDDYARSKQITAADMFKIRNHLHANAMLRKTVAEHYEMIRGKRFDAGITSFGLHTVATLIKPNGTVIPIGRKGHSHG